MSDVTHWSLLAASWLVYFAVHSALAGLGLKARLAARRPGWLRGYRLFYNLQAVVLLIPPAALTLTRPGPMVWAWPGVWGWIMDALALAAVAGFLVTLRHYDMGTFLGLRQWRAGETAPGDQEPLRLSALHRHVRHPWYALGLVVIWTRDMPASWLVSALCLSAYLLVGYRLEERRLVGYYGAAYREYQRRVPALIPLPGRSLSRAAAARLAGTPARDPG